MSNREWLYRLVLHAYPPEFRGSFGREMLSVYRAQHRDGVVDIRYWFACITDAVATAPRLWMEELHEGLRATGGTMRRMGMLAAIAGVLETANSLIELRASAFGERDTVSQAVVLLVTATGVLLTVAGLALLFRGDAARRLGRIGAAGCLGAFSLMLVTRPMMSMAATGLGIAVPLALWLFLYVRRTKGETRPAA
ncbi:MAG TPA: hypothetical protein VGM67_00255 [Gemmatimonadaceae bacterium]|jgi:hypothetical protein